MFTLTYNVTDGFEDIQLFDYLDRLDKIEVVPPPTENSDPNLLCIHFIDTYSTAGVVFDYNAITKCDGFNKLKSTLQHLLYLKRHTPWLYSMLEYTYRCN